MINKLLTTFNRNNIKDNTDLGEKIGNIGLGLLRIGFGKTFIVKKISDEADKITFTQKVYSTSTRVAVIALFIFALPVTIILAGIGHLGTTFSKSHKHIFNSYSQNKLVPIVEFKPLDVIPDIHPDSSKTTTTTIQERIKQDILPEIDLSLHPEKEPEAPFVGVKPLDTIPVQHSETPTQTATTIQQDILPIGRLWSRIEKETAAQLKSLEFLSREDLNHRFLNIRCPKKTVVALSGQYLHANKVGEGVTQRSFVASQAPMPADYAMFWQVIFEEESTIFDLTTMRDQLDGGVTKYYPEQLNEPLQFGSISVKLIKESDRTYTYQMENVETGVVKNINRFHYRDWIDFGAVSLPALDLLVQEVETLSPNPKNLLWIHCRAGVGRTGTLITALVLKEKIKSGEIKKENLDDSIQDIIIKLRKQRSPFFVQQPEQLELLRKYANSLLMI